MKPRGTFFLPLIMGTLILPGGRAKADSTQLVLTARENNTISDSTFACRDKIHGYITLPEAVRGEHMLEGRWYSPQGKMVQYSQIPLSFPAPGAQTAYLWLAFDKEGFLQNPFMSIPRETARRAYNGQWQVAVYWDGKLLIQKPFNVQCSA